MDEQAVLDYIRDYWPRIIREKRSPEETTLIGLPKRFLVPADGPMFQEMYYWDSYFMSLGLVGSEHEQLIVDMTENLAYLRNRFGLIPNASRYYFLSRSQPPFFSQLVRLACEVKERRGDGDVLSFRRRMMRVAEQEHETVWLGETQPHHRRVYAGLSRYFDINFLDVLAEIESGWDRTTRCDDRWLQHLPVDLNSILYAREMDLAGCADLVGLPPDGRSWQQWAEDRAEAMHRLMWDDESGFFHDYDYINKARNPQISLAGFYPLWAGLATPEQAARMVLEALPRFECEGGLVTTLEERPGRQWAYPNGWAPLQWLVTQGLQRYGFHEDARRLMQKWVDTCTAVFKRTGKMWEKYNVVAVDDAVEKGLYGMVLGFGWSNAVYVDFVRRLGE